MARKTTESVDAPEVLEAAPVADEPVAVAPPEPDAPVEPLPHAAGPPSTKVRVFERITCREIEILRTDFNPERHSRSKVDAKKPFHVEATIR